MTSKQKIKGSTWERDISKLLGESLGGIFSRTPHSGAAIGGKNAYKKTILSTNAVRTYKGDIVPPDRFPYFNIEAKNYADMAFHQLILNNCPQLDKWIEQTLAPADEHDINMTIFKITRKGAWLVIDSEFLPYFTLANYILYKNSHIIVEFEPFIKSNTETIRELGSYGKTKFLEEKATTIIK